MRSTLTGLNSISGLGDRTAELGFNDGLARSGVWWAGTAGEFGANNLSPSARVPPLVPHWLSTTGFTVFPGCPLSQLYLSFTFVLFLLVG